MKKVLEINASCPGIASMMLSRKSFADPVKPLMMHSAPAEIMQPAAT